MAITESSKVGQQLAEALRLPEQLVGFTLRCWVDEPLTVTAVYYPDVDEDQLQTVTTVLREVRLEAEAQYPLGREKCR